MHLVWSIQDLYQTIKNMQKNKFDCIIVFDGKRGLGKSTGGLKLAFRDPKFKMANDLVFSRGDVLEFISKKVESFIVADEMINVTYNRDFFVEDQKKILKVLNMYRDSVNVLIACVPNFADLDKQFRALVKIRVNVVRRGMAIVHTQNQSSYSTDPWDLKLNEKIEQRWMGRSNFKPQYSKLTTFRGILRYGALTVQQQKVYDDLKKEKRGKVVEGDSDAEGDLKMPTKYYDRIFKGIKEGKVSRADVDNLVVSMGLRIDAVLVALRIRAKSEGLALKNLFNGSGNKNENHINLNDDIPEIILRGVETAR